MCKHSAGRDAPVRAQQICGREQEHDSRLGEDSRRAGLRNSASEKAVWKAEDTFCRADFRDAEGDGRIQSRKIWIHGVGWNDNVAVFEGKIWSTCKQAPEHARGCSMKLVFHDRAIDVPFYGQSKLCDERD